MNSAILINATYIVSACLFILGLKLLSHPSTSRKGNTVSAIGMFLAVVITLLDKDIISYHWIITGIAIGGVIGAIFAKKVEMTSMPELVSLFNGFGGLASLAVGWISVLTLANQSVSELARGVVEGSSNQGLSLTISNLSIIIGGITFSGSVIAWGKLSGKMTSGAITFAGQRWVNIALILALVAVSYQLTQTPDNANLIYSIIVLSVVLGVLSVIPIGGADMPVVISLLNSYSGIAATAAGFAIGNNILIVAGLLVGASGIILTNIMCKAMNRSLVNVLLSGFSKPIDTSMKVEGELKALSPEDAFYVLEAAQSVLVVPGYGMAVAQAQHAVKELQELIESNGGEVVYGIHPVAGRMPGHMNVLLAEADVSYDLLLEMDAVNQRMETFDVAIVIGANDVVNPAAKEMKGSPIYGMPVIEVERARTVFVLKRTANAGFAGVDNPLFFKDNTRMIYGDAKDTLNSVIREFGDD
ncbi:NAD(P)(+) transhydrogenase (Re/Si-specific) subunit beta [Alteromonas sp. a30]|uniref:NAD(P)(+) transhydrogenase (Re/Si-specific) subunit beta n=1 Tax=Alteromonas sp. a30 TaxID=2730917 RepID=UPI00227F6E58|nr:NAD(P)(+) transhydrogenase (Re/Si-specific) subunit beta [Alteromonas sp. a30]MCY7296057.1 NAD(P)(+) transhydrogenase (Re/Si-specific) subunit beta [Alteromonas sp. a30]